MIGVLTSYFYYHGKLWRYIKIKVAPFLALLLIPVIIISMQPDEVMDDSLLLKILLFPIANLAAAGLLVFGIDLRVNNLFYRFVKPIARWSYSAYLVSLLVLSAMGCYLPNVTEDTAILYFLGFIFATLIVSVVIYNVFERNILLWHDHWIK